MSIKLTRDRNGEHAMDRYGTCDGALLNWGPRFCMKFKARMLRAKNDLGLATRNAVGA